MLLESRLKKIRWLFAVPNFARKTKKLKHTRTQSSSPLSVVGTITKLYLVFIPDFHFIMYLSGGCKCCLVHHVGNICTVEPDSLASQKLQVNALAHLHLGQVELQDFRSTCTARISFSSKLAFASLRETKLETFR